MCHERHMNAHSLAMFYHSVSCRNAIVLKCISRENNYQLIQIERRKRFCSKCEESLTSQILNRKYNCPPYKAETYFKPLLSRMKTCCTNPLSPEPNSIQMATCSLSKSIRDKDSNNQDCWQSKAFPESYSGIENMTSAHLITLHHDK